MNVADRIVQAIERDIGDRQGMWDWGRDPESDEEIRTAWRSLVLGILQEVEDEEGLLPLPRPSTAHACGRCGAPSKGLHSCPYAQEISNNDDPEYCTCCERCEQNCIGDI